MDWFVIALLTLGVVSAAGGYLFRMFREGD
jgi:hypothetical protein